MKIGSFNVLNLKTNVITKSSQEKENFKVMRIEKIAELIRKQEFEVVALQEIQSNETVEQIVRKLNENDGFWDYVHCDRVYKELNDYTRPGEKRLEDRAELAFIFDSRKVEFVKDFVFYKGIHERFLSAIQWFVTALLGVATIAVATNESKSLLAEENDNDKKRKRKVPHGTGTTVGVAATVGAWFGMEKIKENSHKQIEDFLRKTLRPPLVALFKPLSSEKNIQLRFVNMHSQFAYDKSPVKARQTESRFVLQHIFHIVNTQRLLSPPNLNSTAFTIAAGDFNLSKKRLDEVIARRSVKSVEPNLAVMQNHPSTIVCTNEKDVKDGKVMEFEYKFTKNDYDHFILDGELWGVGNGNNRTQCIGDGVVMDLSTLRPKHPSNPHRQAISDHHPIAIFTEEF